MERFTHQSFLWLAEGALPSRHFEAALCRGDSKSKASSGREAERRGRVGTGSPDCREVQRQADGLPADTTHGFYMHVKYSSQCQAGGKAKSSLDAMVFCAGMGSEHPTPKYATFGN